MPLVKKGPLKRHKWPTEELQKAAKVIIDKDTKKPKKIKSKGKVKGKSKSKVKSKSKDKSNDKVAAETEGNAEVVVASSASRVERGSGDGPHQPRSQPSLVALHFSDISLRHSDVQLLQSHSEGLNERLVAFYFAYLQHRRYRTEPDLIFLPPALTARLGHMDMRELRHTVRDRRLHEKPFILLPLSTHPRPHGHWSLLLVSRPDGKFFHFDSQDNFHTKLAGSMAETLRAPLGAWDFVVVTGRCLQQHPQIYGDPQSGIHLFCMAEHVADYVTRCGYATSSLLIAWEQIDAMRTSLLQLIQSLGGILPPKKGH
ncbi:uncharacterized protein [Drosophila bipectinata]|uniref:uncharacterized protein n=1 Tax=Drosophila bipectinata TaxID=42026 RepID=UPI001C8A9D46|nr:uncharacterized protein LOC108133459 isoform X1 [Drosophila bipectinata]